MSIAIDELRDWLLTEAEEIAEVDRANGFHDQTEYDAHLLQAVDALDLLEEALAEATSLSDEVEEALSLVKILGYTPAEYSALSTSQQMDK